MNDKTVAVKQAGELAAPQSEAGPVALMRMIESAAVNPDVDVEKLERMWAMYSAERDRMAEQSFNAALNRAQRRSGRVAADANNPQTRSRYATYAALDRALRPIYSEEGLSLSFDTGDTEPDKVLVLCYVSHEAGHTRTYRALMPADGKGAKGGDVMTKTHAAGSAMSYGMRYLLKLIFNVAVGEDDDDGNGAGAGIKLTEEQAANIEALITEVGADKAKFLKYLKVDAIGDILGRNYDAAVSALESKRGK